MLASHSLRRSLVLLSQGNYIKRLRKKFQDKLGEAGTIAEESISSIRTVRSFSNEEKSMDEYGVKIDESFALGKKMAMTIGQSRKK